MKPGTRLMLGLEIDADGTITGAVLPPDFADAVKAAGLQLSVALIADGYEKRKADFAKIHDVQDDDLRFMAQMLRLSDGARVLDLGCGYGEVSAHIIAEADRLGLRIELSMCDLHYAQLQRVPPELRARAKDVVVGDARRIPFPDATFDAVVVKMMLHEVPSNDQPGVCEQVLRVLHPGAARHRTRGKRRKARTAQCLLPFGHNAGHGEANRADRHRQRHPVQRHRPHRRGMQAIVVSLEGAAAQAATWLR